MKHRQSTADTAWAMTRAMAEPGTPQPKATMNNRAVLRYQGQHIWRPTAWGMAATRALKAMQRNNQIAIIKEFTVMPNHIHLFIFYKKFHPRLPEWFIEKTREFLLYYIEPPRDWPVPIWEESVDTQMVYTDTAQYAVAESLKEYAHHWKYDPLHKR